MGCTPLIRVLLILNEKRRIEKMKFTEILEELRKGKKVTREKWLKN